MASVSLPMGDFVNEEYVARALADTAPGFLEIRIDLDYFEWGLVFGGTSIRSLTLILHMRAPPDKRGEVNYVLVSPLLLSASVP